MHISHNGIGRKHLLSPQMLQPKSSYKSSEIEGDAHATTELSLRPALAARSRTRGGSRACARASVLLAHSRQQYHAAGTGACPLVPKLPLLRFVEVVQVGGGVVWLRPRDEPRPGLVGFPATPGTAADLAMLLVAGDSARWLVLPLALLLPLSGETPRMVPG